VLFVILLQAMMSSDAVLSTPAALTLAHMVKAITEPFQADIAASFLQALQPHLAQLLLLVHNSNSGVSTAATSACLGLMMASIKIGPAAMAAILDALMANDRKGLKNLMLGLADSTGCKLAGSLSAIGMATVSFLAGAVCAGVCWSHSLGLCGCNTQQAVGSNVSWQDGAFNLLNCVAECWLQQRIGI